MTTKEYDSLKVGDSIVTTAGCVHIVRKKYKDMIGVDAVGDNLTKDGYLPIAIYACTKLQ